MNDQEFGASLDALINNLFELSFCGLELSAYARSRDLPEIADQIENHSREEWFDASRLLDIAGIPSKKPALHRSPLFERSVREALTAFTSLSEVIQHQLSGCYEACPDGALREALRSVTFRNADRRRQFGSVLKVLSQSQK